MRNKSRLLEILDFLYKNTDDEHYETTKTILAHLEEKEIPVDRKTLESDMIMLQELGFGITKTKSSPNKYRWDRRLFSQAELQMLIDMVLSSKFVTKKKSKELTRKLSSLASTYNSQLLKNSIDCIDRPRTDNTQVYHTVNMITDAIGMKKIVSFKYTEYNGNKEKVYRNNGERYKVSPYKLYCNDNNYYLLGFDEKHQGIIAFRIDRMENCRSAADGYREKPEDLSIDEYAYKCFRMYDGEEETVQLEVRDDLMKYIIDKFGFDVKTCKNGGDTFMAKVPVKLSPTFYSWVFQFAGGIKIVGPEKAKNEYEEMKRK